MSNDLKKQRINIINFVDGQSLKDVISIMESIISIMAEHGVATVNLIVSDSFSDEDGIYIEFGCEDSGTYFNICDDLWERASWPRHQR